MHYLNFGHIKEADRFSDKNFYHSVWLYLCNKRQHPKIGNSTNSTVGLNCNFEDKKRKDIGVDPESRWAAICLNCFKALAKYSSFTSF